MLVGSSVTGAIVLGVTLRQMDESLGVQTIVTLASRLLKPTLSTNRTVTVSPATPLKLRITKDSPTSSRASKVDLE